MGLRETKAARTRAQIIDVAVRLFAERGYEKTTMEEIAERAEVGSSTLYRYFPSKDLIVLDPFTNVGALARALRERPETEPIEIALAHAIHEALDTIVISEPHLDAFRAIIDQSPAPRARLWDLIAQNRDLLEQAVADRLGRDTTDMFVIMTTRSALLIIELAADTWRGGDHRHSISEVADAIIDRVAAAGLVLPRRDAAPGVVPPSK